MRKRRSSRVTWFPNTGAQFLGNRFISLNFNQLVPELSDGTPVAQGNTSLFCIPITRDYTKQAQAGSTDASLRDYVEGQDWALKRIVGSIFVNIQGSAQTAAVAWPRVLVTCGLLIARAEEVSQAATDLDDGEIDPQAVDNIDNPWIWRRTWYLANPLSTTSLEIAGMPSCNMLYGGNMSGPFIDSKVSRRVTKEHRLFFAGSIFGASQSGLTVSGTKIQQVTANVWSDFRILGSMRKARNVSSF